MTVSPDDERTAPADELPEFADVVCQRLAALTSAVQTLTVAVYGDGARMTGLDPLPATMADRRTAGVIDAALRHAASAAAETAGQVAVQTTAAALNELVRTVGGTIHVHPPTAAPARSKRIERDPAGNITRVVEE